MPEKVNTGLDEDLNTIIYLIDEKAESFIHLIIYVFIGSCKKYLHKSKTTFEE